MLQNGCNLASTAPKPASVLYMFLKIGFDILSRKQTGVNVTCLIKNTSILQVTTSVCYSPNNYNTGLNES